MAALSLVTMADAAVAMRRFQRRAAARRVTQLVQSGAVFADDFKALIGDETDVVIEAHLKLALRARGLRDVIRSDNTVRGILEFNPDTDLWGTKAGHVSSEGCRFSDVDTAVDWLERHVAEFIGDPWADTGDYYLQIGVVELPMTCDSALPHNPAGFCEVCWAVEQGRRADIDHQGLSIPPIALGRAAGPTNPPGGGGGGGRETGSPLTQARIHQPMDNRPQVTLRRSTEAMKRKRDRDPA